MSEESGRKERKDKAPGIRILDIAFAGRFGEDGLYFFPAQSGWESFFSKSGGLGGYT